MKKIKIKMIGLLTVLSVILNGCSNGIGVALFKVLPGIILVLLSLGLGFAVGVAVVFCLVKYSPNLIKTAINKIKDYVQ